MTEQLIEFETAKLAKEKGFNLAVDVYYNIPNMKIYYWKLKKIKNFKIECAKGNYNPIDWNSSKFKDVCLSAPTQSLLQKWLRDVHNIHIIVSPLKDKTFKVEYSKDLNYWSKHDLFKTYEKALEKGLYQVLKLIENDSKN